MIEEINKAWTKNMRDSLNSNQNRYIMVDVILISNRIDGTAT